MVEQLASISTVFVTDYAEGYQILNYFRRYTPAPIRLIIWLARFLQLMEERVVAASPGVILESFGRLLFTDVTIFVAPMHKEELVAALGGLPQDLLRDSPGQDLLTLDDLRPRPPLDHLFRYLLASGRVVPLEELPAKA
jgi:hypothetical protein